MPECGKCNRQARSPGFESPWLHPRSQAHCDLPLRAVQAALEARSRASRRLVSQRFCKVSTIACSVSADMWE